MMSLKLLLFTLAVLLQSGLSRSAPVTSTTALSKRGVLGDLFCSTLLKSAKTSQDLNVEGFIERKSELYSKKDGISEREIELMRAVAKYYGNGETKLMNAAELGNLDDVKSELKNGADINAMDDLGKTPLAHAVYGNQLKVVKFLVDNGADVNLVKDCNWGVLDKVPLLDRKEISDYFSQKRREYQETGWIRSLKKNVFGETPLMLAAEEGDLDSVKSAIKNGYDVNEKNNNGQTALTYASKTDNLAIVKLLIKNGAQVDGNRKGAPTAIDWARIKGNTEIADYLTSRNMLHK